MSNEKQARADIYGILATLAETTEPGGIVPASIIYISLGHSWDRHIQAASILDSLGLAVTSTSTIKLTPKGREAGNKVLAIMARGRGVS